MISELHIENIAVIERADIAFGAGFNVLTGETGAGKSIVIDSIDAVLGGRVTRELVRAGAEKALVNAVFTDVDVSDWLAENDLDAEEELILQRRISADGKSACRVNGAAVTVQQLRALGALLLDIHGQQDGRQLLDEARHLDYLDRFAGETAALDAYRAAFETYRGVKREMDRLRMDELEKERLTDRLSAEIEELEKAKLVPGEEAELESRQGLMKNAVRLTEALEGAYGALYEADESALGLVADAERFTAAAAAMAPELEEAAKSISEARFLLTDAAERIGDLRDGLNFSEEEFDRVESRLALLRRLERKYNTNEAGLAERLDADRARLAEIESADDLLVQLERDLARARSAVLAAGKTLTERRRAAHRGGAALSQHALCALLRGDRAERERGRLRRHGLRPRALSHERKRRGSAGTHRPHRLRRRAEPHYARHEVRLRGARPGAEHGLRRDRHRRLRGRGAARRRKNGRAQPQPSSALHHPSAPDRGDGGHAFFHQQGGKGGAYLHDRDAAGPRRPSARARAALRRR